MGGDEGSEVREGRTVGGGDRRWPPIVLAALVVVLLGLLATYERVVEVRPRWSPSCPMEGHLERRERLWGGGQWYEVGPDGDARSIDVAPGGEPYEIIESCPAGMSS